jgi:hypothetical protein
MLVCWAKASEPIISGDQIHGERKMKKPPPRQTGTGVKFYQVDGIIPHTGYCARVTRGSQIDFQ